jgi:small subunit ribosomal protein S5
MSEDTQDDAEKAEEEVKSTVEVEADATPEGAEEAVATAGAEDEAVEATSTTASDDSPKEEEPPSEKLEKARSILGERSGRRDREEEDDLFEKVVFINRCAKVVKGGRRFSFSALIVTGDKEGKVGFGFGKAQEVAECIKKASESAKKAMQSVKIGPNTIPHPVIGRHGGGRVLLLPASPGTGLIAGGGVRAVVEAAGVKDVLAKSMGSNNHANVVKATLDALNQLRDKEEIYALRGKRIESKRAL